MPEQSTPIVGEMQAATVWKKNLDGTVMPVTITPQEYSERYVRKVRKPSNDNADDNSAATKAFKLLTRADLNAIPPPTFLIDGLIIEGSNNLVYGEDGSAKSFVCLDWALSTATGLPWFGHTTTQGDVVYIYTEGWTKLPARVDAWVGHHGREADRIFFLTENVHLSKTKQVEKLIAAIRGAGVNPRLIFIDTLAQNKGPGLDVNKDADMDLYHEGTKMLRNAFPGCATVTVHHSGKDSSKGAKGATSIEDPMDGVFKVVKPKNMSQGTVTDEKQRDAEAGHQIHFRLIDAGPSAVIVPDDGTVTNWKDVPEQPARNRTPASDTSILLALAKRRPDGLTHSELFQKSGIAAKATFNRALKRLKDGGKVSPGPDGRYMLQGESKVSGATF